MVFHRPVRRSRLAGLALAALLAAPPAVAAPPRCRSSSSTSPRPRCRASRPAPSWRCRWGGPFGLGARRRRHRRRAVFCALDDALGGAFLWTGPSGAACRATRPTAPSHRRAQLARMVAATRGWGRRATSTRQGPRPADGVDLPRLQRRRRQKPVSDALRDWYLAFTPAGQIFYRDQLNAGHAQISAACADSPDGACNVCAQTGGRFINACPSPASRGALRRRRRRASCSSMARSGAPPPRPRREGSPSAGAFIPPGAAAAPVPPARIAMATPATCMCRRPAAPPACRLHIAFHGCQQDAGSLGHAFATTAGFNEWADAGPHRGALPQARSTLPEPGGQTRWAAGTGGGYNDFLCTTRAPAPTPARRGADRRGVADGRAARRRRGRLAPGGGRRRCCGVVDRSASQVALAWTPVAGATAYVVERAEAGGEPQRRARVDGGPRLVGR